MKTLFSGLLIATMILMVCPSFPASLSAFASDIVRNARLASLGSSSAALERMIADEQNRLASIRAKYGQWRALEVCRADLAEFERFAAATNTPYVRQTCS